MTFTVTMFQWLIIFFKLWKYNHFCLEQKFFWVSCLRYFHCNYQFSTFWQKAFFWPYFSELDVACELHWLLNSSNQEKVISAENIILKAYQKESRWRGREKYVTPKSPELMHSPTLQKQIIALEPPLTNLEGSLEFWTSEMQSLTLSASKLRLIFQAVEFSRKKH